MTARHSIHTISLRFYNKKLIITSNCRRLVPGMVSFGRGLNSLSAFEIRIDYMNIYVNIYSIAFNRRPIICSSFVQI